MCGSGGGGGDDDGEEEGNILQYYQISVQCISLSNFNNFEYKSSDQKKTTLGFYYFKSLPHMGWTFNSKSMEKVTIKLNFYQIKF